MRTTGGLRKDDLLMNKRGKVVSAKRSAAATARYPALKAKLCGTSAAPSKYLVWLKTSEFPLQTVIGDPAYDDVKYFVITDGLPCEHILSPVAIASDAAAVSEAKSAGYKLDSHHRDSPLLFSNDRGQHVRFYVNQGYEVPIMANDKEYESAIASMSYFVYPRNYNFNPSIRNILTSTPLRGLFKNVYLGDYKSPTPEPAPKVTKRRNKTSSS